MKHEQRKLTWLGIAAAAAMFAMTGAASATTLSLIGPINGKTVGPQSTSNPCVIAGTECKNPTTMGYNNFTSTGSIDHYNMYSTTPTATVADGVQGTAYTVGQLEGAVGSDTFSVAIDVNTTGAASETLQLFEVIINGVVAYNYVGPTNIGNIANNGNGYADWLLSTVDLSTYAATATVLFHAYWTGAVDGAESFFLVAGAPTPPIGVPIPGALPLFAGGLGGLALLLRRRKRKGAAFAA